MTALKTGMATIDKELKALDAYERVKSSAVTTKRRTGIRGEVQALIEANNGISRADILSKMDAKGNKSAEQSVSNALQALKKTGTVSADDGIYKKI